MTKIKDLLGVILRLDPISGRIKSLGQIRTVNLKSGGQAKVCDVWLEDETGVISLSLWDEQIKTIKEGSYVIVENGYTTTFKGEVRLNVGKYGKLSVTTF
jgi:replication factor A1